MVGFFFVSTRFPDCYQCDWQGYLYVEKSMALFYDRASDKLELGNINFEKIF